MYALICCSYSVKSVRHFVVPNFHDAVLNYIADLPGFYCIIDKTFSSYKNPSIRLNWYFSAVYSAIKVILLMLFQHKIYAPNYLLYIEKSTQDLNNFSLNWKVIVSTLVVLTNSTVTVFAINYNNK